MSLIAKKGIKKVSKKVSRESTILLFVVIHSQPGINSVPNINFFFEIIS